MLKLQFKDRRKDSVWLVEQRFTIGKSSQNSLVIEDPSIEASHIEIISEKDRLTLFKKSNKARVLVNGQEIQDHSSLKADDTLTLGNVELELVDSQAFLSKQNPQTKANAIWSLNSSASWLSQNDFIINKKTIIGRDAACDICLNLDYLSRQHVQLEPQNGKLFIEDLNSSNGTFVNGERIQRSELQPGDKIKLDVLTFEVRGPSNKSNADPHKTIIRNAPSTKPNTQEALSSSNTSEDAVSKVRKASQLRRKKLASEGKQAWISGENQLKAKAERKKGIGGFLFLALTLTILAGAAAFFLSQ